MTALSSNHRILIRNPIINGAHTVFAMGISQTNRFTNIFDFKAMVTATSGSILRRANI